MKTLSKISLFALLAITISQVAFSQACTFVSPLVQVISTKDSTDGGGNPFCVQVISLTVDIDVNNGNKWTYIHLWRTQDYHTTDPTFNYGHAPTNANILSNDLLTLALTYSSTPVLSNTYAPDATENPQVQDAANGVTFTTSPSVGTPGATTFTFNGIRIVTPGVCDPGQTFKGDAWSSQSANGGTVQCTLLGFVFATSDPTATANILCAAPLTINPNFLNFTVTAAGTGDVITFQFDVYANTDATTAFDPNLDAKIYTGSTTYTVDQTGGTASPTISFTSGPATAGYISIPAIYPSPYSTNTPDKYKDLYVVIKNITITNGGTTTNISNSLVSVASNTCQSLPVTFGEMKVVNINGQLLVNWQSLTENGCKEYVIQASKNGSNWKDIATVTSKATNGISTSALEYNYQTNLPITFAGISIAFLLLSMFKSKIFRIALLIAAVVIIVSCLKGSKEVDINKTTDAVYVRIAQHNLDGTVQYSKTIKAVNQ
jgi:hypothetical protein